MLDSVPPPHLEGSATLADPAVRDTRALRSWQRKQLSALHELRVQAKPTPLHKIDFPRLPNICIYLKDERVHPSGSLKHRLAGSLFEYALCHGWLAPEAPVVEASSGSTAISDAWYARRLGLEFVAVVPAGTALAKRQAILAEGGDVHVVDDTAALSDSAATLANELGGHFMDQFRFASEASDWRGEDNIAAESLRQFKALGELPPQTVILGAGTGGTAATFARHLRYRSIDTDILGVDPECSVYRAVWAGQPAPTLPSPPAGANPIEGIGRPHAAQAFLKSAFDFMLTVEDAASLAAARWLNRHFGLCGGPSTGTALTGALRHAERLQRLGASGTILSLICDDGERYGDTLYEDDWLGRHYPAYFHHSEEIERVTGIGEKGRTGPAYADNST